MDYPEDGDVQNKKEFLQRIIKNKPDELRSEASAMGIVIPQYYQRFTRDFMALQTPYEKLLVIHPTGSGKTITSLLLAMSIIQNAKRQYQRERITTQKVFIVGFTAENYVKTLITKPYFGFVTADEADELNNATDYMYYRELYIRYKKRLKYQKYGGVFQFYGYKKLLNRLIKDDVDIEKGITDEMVNHDFYEQFENSVIICDEIHNVYNSKETNNYGIALQYILDHVKVKKVMFLSWTPITNKATEVFDLMKLFNISMAETNITPIILNKISQKMKGKVSYLDALTEDYPELIYEGKKLKTINPYRFTILKMSNIHERLARDNSDVYVNDFCFPMPKSEKNPLGVGSTKEDINRLKTLSDKERKKLRVNVNRNVLSGPFLDDLKTYSAKYHHMIKLILKILRTPSINGKIFIYHRYITVSGVLFIGSVLSHYGITEVNAAVPKNALDVNGKPKSKDFIPARFALIHSDMSKEDIAENITTFNSPVNAVGDKIKIIVGGNIMRESYDMKSINHIIIAHRPDNYKTMNQIFGRGVRKNSHILVDNKTVRTYILIHEKSREEKHYIDKYKDLLEINKVEATLIATSIDKDITWGDTEKTLRKNKHYSTKTFEIYNKKEEVEETIINIKRLFMMDKVWTYDALWKAVQNPPFITYAPLIEKSSFVLALDFLLYDEDLMHDMNDGIRQVFSSSDKRVEINGAYFVIKSVGEYYILFPYNSEKNEEIIDYGTFAHATTQLINVNTYVKVREETYNYDDRLRTTAQRWAKVPIENWGNFMCRYEIPFYIKTVENCIQYIFDLWVKKRKKSEHHLFYFKLLYYYAAMDLIVFANDANNMKNLYKQYIAPDYEIKHVYALAKCDTCDTVDIGKYQTLIKSAKVAEKGRCARVPGNLLPVGHFMDEYPKFYTPNDGWFETREFKMKEKKKENDIVIGYNVRVGKQLVFKVRPPLQKQTKSTDKRKTERGAICKFVPKDKLEHYLKKLGVDIPDKYYAGKLCEILQLRLIELEKKSPDRYFYQFFEKQPF